MALSESTVRELRKELSRLREETSAIERVLSLAGSGNGGSPEQPEMRDAPLFSTPRPLFKGKSIPESILHVLSAHSGKPLNSVQVAKELRAGGIEITNGKLTQRVSGELTRLFKNKRVSRVDRGLYTVTEH